MLVREKAAHYLGEATTALSELEVAYANAYIPEPTRDAPYPSAEALKHLRAIGTLKAQIADVTVRVRSASVPTSDKTWLRLRDERTMLLQLLTFDQNLIHDAKAVAELARALTAFHWESTAGATNDFAAPLAAITATLRERSDLLLMPTL